MPEGGFLGFGVGTRGRGGVSEAFFDEESFGLAVLDEVGSAARVSMAVERLENFVARVLGWWASSRSRSWWRTWLQINEMGAKVWVPSPVVLSRLFRLKRVVRGWRVRK